MNYSQALRELESIRTQLQHVLTAGHAMDINTVLQDAGQAGSLSDVLCADSDGVLQFKGAANVWDFVKKRVIDLNSIVGGAGVFERKDDSIPTALRAVLDSATEITASESTVIGAMPTANDGNNTGFAALDRNGNWRLLNLRIGGNPMGENLDQSLDSDGTANSTLTKNITIDQFYAFFSGTPTYKFIHFSPYMQVQHVLKRGDVLSWDGPMMAFHDLTYILRSMERWKGLTPSEWYSNSLVLRLSGLGEHFSWDGVGGDGVIADIRTLVDNVRIEYGADGFAWSDFPDYATAPCWQEIRRALGVVYLVVDDIYFGIPGFYRHLQDQKENGLNELRQVYSSVVEIEPLLTASYEAHEGLSVCTAGMIGVWCSWDS